MADSQPEIIQQLSVPVYAPRLAPTPIPTSAWDDEPLLCLKVNDQWVSHILGVMAALDQPDTWLGTSEEIYAARQQVNEIMAAFMQECDPMSNCCPDPITRIAADGSLEVSDDGGATWHPATTEDPRNTVPQLAPLGGTNGDDKRCKAANNVVRQLKEQQTQWSSNLGTGLSVLQLSLGFAAAIAGFFLTAGTLSVFLVPAILSLAAALVGTGSTAYNDLFTSDVWDYALCQFYNLVDPDGTYTDTNYNNILANFDSEFTGNLALAFSAVLTSWQLVGLNRAARIPTTDNLDCSGCAPGCVNDWTVYFQSGDHFGEILEQTSTYIIAQTTNINTNGVYYIFLITADIESCCYINSMEVLEGSGIQFYAGFCGAAIGTVTTILSGEGCFNQLQPQSNAPFKVKFNLDACP